MQPSISLNILSKVEEDAIGSLKEISVPTSLIQVAVGIHRYTISPVIEAVGADFTRVKA
jgi:hypothetical protein